MRLFAMCALLCLISCGPRVRDRIVEPPSKQLEVGEKAVFELDAAESSSVVTSGRLVVTVADITPEATIVDSKADVVTALGEKHVELKQSIKNEILTLDFLEKLRADKKYQSPDMDLFYNGLTRDGCDIVTVSRLKDHPDTVITPTICVASRKLPRLRIVMRFSGFDVTASFKMVE